MEEFNQAIFKICPRVTFFDVIRVDCHSISDEAQPKIEIMSPSKIYVCKTCMNNFKSNKDLKRHVRSNDCLEF